MNKSERMQPLSRAKRVNQEVAKMAIINNVNIYILERIIKEAETDKSRVKRSQKIDG